MNNLKKGNPCVLITLVLLLICMTHINSHECIHDSLDIKLEDMIDEEPEG